MSRPDVSKLIVRLSVFVLLQPVFSLVSIASEPGVESYLAHAQQPGPRKTPFSGGLLQTEAAAIEATIPLHAPRESCRHTRPC